MGYAKRSNCQGGEELWIVGGDLEDGPAYMDTSMYYDVRAAVWLTGPQVGNGGIEETSVVVLDNVMYRMGGNADFGSSAKGEELVPCKGCFSWPMFVPATTGMGR